jgi:hypothetical protein
MRTSTLPTLWRVLETGSRVVFGEMMPPGALEAASEAARGCELFFLDRHLKPRLYRRHVAL